MNTIIETPAAAKKILPRLTKMSSTYKLIVPAKVEEKIRYLCRKFPTLEWSGVLFHTHTGSFEADDLVITCQDIYPMDLGTATYTEYKMDPSVVSYIADNFELFDCDMSLVHSHNKMSCFFSGTDLSTLQSEGNDQNCFVSLIVNNEGTYCAAITRKVVTRTETQVIASNESYEFFGEGEITSESIIIPSEAINIEEETEIQYFMLDVEREIITNPFDYLDARFDEIEAKKRETSRKLPVYTPPTTTGYGNDYDTDFYDWIHKKSNTETPKVDPVGVYSPTLFDKQTMDEMIDPTKWAPDPTIIHYLAVQLVTCSLIVSKDLDLKQWVAKWMTKKYTEIFKGTDEVEMENWADFYVEFILNHYDASDVPEELLDDFDQYISSIALDLISELDALPENPYIEIYKTKLTMYVV